MASKRVNRILDWVYIVYFVQHIVVTVLIDSTIVIPEHLQFPIQTFLGKYHIETNKDYLLLNPPAWLQSYVWIELIVQLPFFFAGAYYLYLDNKKIYVPSLIYGVEAAITTVGCLAEVVTTDAINTKEKINLSMLYAPILIMTLLMAVDMSFRLLKFIPGNEVKKAKAKAN